MNDISTLRATSVYSYLPGYQVLCRVALEISPDQEGQRDVINQEALIVGQEEGTVGPAQQLRVAAMGIADLVSAEGTMFPRR